jgi:hypothetical protein
MCLPSAYGGLDLDPMEALFRGDQPRPTLSGLGDLLTAVAVQALIAEGKAAFGLAPLLTIATKDALAEAIGRGWLKATQEVTGRSPIYYQWTA